MPHYDFPQMPPAQGEAQQALRGERRVFTKKGGEGELVPVYERSKLGNGHGVQGPALVESEHTTVYLPQGWGLKVDQYNNLLLEEAGS